MALRSSVFAVAFVASMACFGAASAQTFTPAANSTFLLDLDVEDGNFSLWRANDLTNINALRARTTFVRKGRHERWSPSFTVAVGHDEGEAALQVMAAPRSGPLVMQLVHRRGRETIEEQVFLLPPEFEEAFDLAVDWTADGVVTFTVHSRAAQAVNGYERHEVRIGAAPTGLAISTSTAEVLFDPLQLGSAAP